MGHRIEYGLSNRPAAALAEPKEHEAVVKTRREAPHITQTLVEREEHPLNALCGGCHDRIRLAG
ncbi:MAG: hypothetical protein U0587_13110 [Candidatus Binatia bacterium]